MRPLQFKYQGYTELYNTTHNIQLGSKPSSSDEYYIIETLHKRTCRDTWEKCFRRIWNAPQSSPGRNILNLHVISQPGLEESCCWDCSVQGKLSPKLWLMNQLHCFYMQYQVCWSHGWYDILIQMIAILVDISLFQCISIVRSCHFMKRRKTTLLTFWQLD